MIGTIYTVVWLAGERIQVELYLCPTLARKRSQVLRTLGYHPVILYRYIQE